MLGQVKYTPLLLKIVLTLFGGGGGGGFVSMGRQIRGQTRRRPGNNKLQNKQFNDVVHMLGLTKKEARRLHDSIQGLDLGFRELLEFARDMFRY